MACSNTRYFRKHNAVNERMRRRNTGWGEGLGCGEAPHNTAIEYGIFRVEKRKTANNQTTFSAQKTSRLCSVHFSAGKLGPMRERERGRRRGNKREKMATRSTRDVTSVCCPSFHLSSNVVAHPVQCANCKRLASG